MTRTCLRATAAAIVLLFAASSLPLGAAFADPPPWAPAHGWRDKHDRDDDDHWRERRHHREHDEDRDDEREGYYAAPPPAAVAMPYGLDQRVCNRDLIGAAIGGATGGLIGSNIGKGKGRTITTIGGVLTGLFVGGTIGRRMDQADQACAGQVLEHVPDRQSIVWQGQNPNNAYWVTPTRSYDAGNGRYCREYTSDAVIGGRKQRTYGTACRQPDGSWEIVK